jgi:NAD-dependent DNA ligase
MTDKVLDEIKVVGPSAWVKQNKRQKGKIKRRMKKYSTAYYSGKALISDPDFELLIDCLKILNPLDKYLTAPGWGYKVKRGVKHTYGKIGTLEYFFCYEEIKEIFKQDKDLVIMPKFDGVNTVAYFNKGKLIKFATRGNGFVGKSLNKKILKQQFNIPIEWQKKSFAINGEMILNKVANNNSARDIVAEILNSRKKEKTSASQVKFMPFGLLNIATQQNYEKQVNQLENICGFKIENHIFVSLPSKYELFKIYQDYKKEYAIDGLVISKLDKSLQVAYKFNKEILNDEKTVQQI